MTRRKYIGPRYTVPAVRHAGSGKSRGVPVHSTGPLTRPEVPNLSFSNAASAVACVSCDVNGQGVISAETKIPADVMHRVREAVRQSAVAAAVSGRHARPSASISGQRRASTPGTTHELTSLHQYKVACVTLRYHRPNLSVE